MSVDYSREAVMALDPTSLRAMIRERAHHTIEIQLFEALAKQRPLAADTGSKVRELLEIWEERSLSTDYPDLDWVHALLRMAEQAKRGEEVDLAPFAGSPFDEDTMRVVRRLIYERRSVRHWTEEEVPDSMIDQILDAGLWAAHGCNLNSLRFLVVRERNEPGLFRGADIPGGPVHLVACQDRRVYYVQPGYVAHPDKLENNRVLDCGAAMQNMVLMAHALGLGAVWLTFRDAMVSRIRDRFRLPDHIQVVTYLDVGFPAQTPLPPGRISVQEATLARS
ncbi:MAG: nitroreductase family protein [Chloroflexota bacterium]